MKKTEITAPFTYENPFPFAGFRGETDAGNYLLRPPDNWRSVQHKAVTLPDDSDRREAEVVTRSASATANEPPTDLEPMQRYLRRGLGKSCTRRADDPKRDRLRPQPMCRARRLCATSSSDASDGRWGLWQRVASAHK